MSSFSGLSTFSSAARFVAKVFVRGGVLPWFLGLALFGFGYLSDNFLSAKNLIGVLRQATSLVLVSMAQMIVMLTAGLDLSVGVMLAMTSVVSSLTIVTLWSGFGAGWGAIFLGCAAGLGACMCIGFANGVGVAVFRVPPFVMTLSMSSIVFGLALVLTGGVPVYGMPEAFANVFGYELVLGLPVPVWITLLCVLLLHVFMSWTPMGRYLYAIGGNIRAASMSGVSTRLYLIGAYMGSSLITGIAALLLTARLESGEPNIGVVYPLLSIAACAIGGVSLYGGVGRVPNVVFGALFIVLIQNGMNMLRINSYLQMVAIGLLLMVAVVAENLRQRLLMNMSD